LAKVRISKALDQVGSISNLSLTTSMVKCLYKIMITPPCFKYYCDFSELEDAFKANPSEKTAHISLSEAFNLLDIYHQEEDPFIRKRLLRGVCRHARLVASEFDDRDPMQAKISLLYTTATAMQLKAQGDEYGFPPLDSKYMAPTSK